ncbi:MAG TPA: patatin-like phospholipase family protein [Gemmatimonadales bacterium]|nr:patatin-like phospholipase family protein [Gemmatimonadales bacterium]
MTDHSAFDLAIVLSGGGARAAYQVGVLAAVAERLPNLSIPIITGVSAGAINATYLAGHRGPLSRAVKELQGEWLRLTSDQVYRLPATGVAKATARVLGRRLRLRREPGVHGLLDVRPLARFLRAVVDFEGIDHNIAAGRLKALALSATSYATGETVTFVHGTPDVPIWQRAQRSAIREQISITHVLASCAIPIIFPAVRLDGGFYGDGSVRQTAPLSPAIHLGARRVLAIGMRAATLPGVPSTLEGQDYPTPAQVTALLLHSVFLDALDADVERLQRVNRLLEALPPGISLPEDMRLIKLFRIRPSRDLGAMARGYVPRLPMLMDLIVKSIGGREERGADFLSYLLFEPEYTGLLMELGHEDAMAQWGEMEGLLGEA